MVRAIEFFLGVAEAYVISGIFFAIAFVARGVRRVDPSVTGSSLGFYAMILPGTVLLWPILLAKWIAAGRARGAE